MRYLRTLRNMVIVCLVVVMAVSLMGHTETSSETRFEGVTVNVVNFPGWRCTAPIWRNESIFTARTGAKIVHHDLPGNEPITRQLMDFVTKEGQFDVTWAYNVIDLMYAPYLMSLNKFIDRDYGSVENFRQIMLPKCMDRWIYNGEVKYIPFHVNAPFVVYRKDLFEDPAEKQAFKAQYGYELQVPKTRQQLVDIAKFFTRPEDKLYGLNFAGVGNSGAQMVWTGFYGAGLQTHDSETRTVQFKSGKAREKAVEVIKFWYDLVHTYKVTPNVVAFTHGDVSEFFLGGNSAMSMHYWGDFWDLLQTPEIKADIGEVGSFVWPTLDPGTPLFSNHGYGIPKDAKNPDASWEFIKFAALDEEIQTAMSRESGQGSAVREYMRKFVEEGSVSTALWDTVQVGTQFEQSLYGSEVANVWYVEISRLFAGELSPEDWLDVVIEKTEEVLE